MQLLLKEISFPVNLENIFATVYKKKPYAFWLDGNLIMEGLSRYSFMGGDPLFLIRVTDGITEVCTSSHSKTYNENPFDVIQQVLDSYQLSSSSTADIPFMAGLVGYFGYEMQKYVESVPTHRNDPVKAPEAMWMFVDQILIFDHLEQKAYLSRMITDAGQVEQSERQMDEIIDYLFRASQTPLAEPVLTSVHVQEYEQLFQQRETLPTFVEKMNKIKDYIARGDIYQACFTHQITAPFKTDPFELYRILRRVNPAPFSCYIQMEGISILSTSPERFLKLDQHRMLESRPIKGTRPRSSEGKADQMLMQDLQTSMKDRAENVMIVDLVRNDLGKVSETGGVHVPTLLKVESYATVHQLVSIVKGQLHPDCKPMDAVKAAFPGGSMTGAPKIRALEILHQLETVARGIYSGGLGYIDLRGSFDLSMVIRTIICRQNQAYFHVGGGIVADSDPEQEYQETMDKAYALKKAIIQAKIAELQTRSCQP